MPLPIAKSKEIPTRTVSIGQGDEKMDIQLYEWWTKDEQLEYLAATTGNPKIKFKPKSKGEFDIKDLVIDLNNKAMLDRGVKALVNIFCRNLTYDEYNVMRPGLREELDKVLLEHIQELKKK